MEEKPNDPTLDTLIRELQDSRKREEALAARIMEYKDFAIRSRTYLTTLKLACMGLRHTSPEHLLLHAAGLEMATIDMELWAITTETRLAAPVFPEPPILH